VRPAITETTSLGAAFLAGLAVGFWKDMDEIQTQWKVGKEFHPRMSPKQVEKLRNRWHQALGRAKGWNEPEGELGKSLRAEKEMENQDR
jgi:glycerol kinase